MALVMNETKSRDFKSLISRFTIPMELLEDIVYCQRSLRLYMRLHQILVNRLPDKLKNKQMEELERDICDIGREQNALIARLRSTLELYYISIKNENVQIDREIGNAYISRIISYNMENGNAVLQPKTVKKRLSEVQLLAHYGLHDAKRKTDNNKLDNKFAAPANLKQESLLKPKSERFALQKTNLNTYPYSKSDLRNETEGNAIASPNINNSRLNLLQALNKARNQSLNHVKPVNSPPTLTIDAKETIEISSSHSSTTSDDSLDVPLVSPLYSEDETEISQEIFLRKFGLYTIEYSHYLQQKRSQRRRRNVQSNEKSDFHYGKLDMFEKMNKRKKTYLHSPPATRAVKRKRMDKESEGCTSKSTTSTDRSTSSSPDQKLLCNECNSADNLNKCGRCNDWYHKNCHKTAPKMIAKKICPQCYMRLKEAKDAKNLKELRNSRESKELKESKEEKDIKEPSTTIKTKTAKNTKDDADLGVAPLDN